MEKRMREIIESAAIVIVSRSGDISTEDGVFATTDIDALLNLQIAIVNAFDLDNDDVELKDISKITTALNMHQSKERK